MARTFDYTKIIYIFLIILFAISGPLQSQVSVSGPICIVPGLPYQYVLTAKQDTKSRMRVCVTGGILPNGRQCTVQDSIVTVINVTWKDTTSHRLEIMSSSGNVNLRLKATTSLQGGFLNETDRVQIADTASKIFVFRCTDATGGACKRRYAYQWQQSIDGLNWKDIKGATSKDLSFKGEVKVNTYFRRITNEANSNMTAYSEAGLLIAVFEKISTQTVQ
jgi:hypothetical protein